MGDIKRKKKKFSRPRKLFDSVRIETENAIVKKYGLKNKREVWKAKSKVSTIRRQAKNLIGKPVVQQNAFFEKLNKVGLNVQNISDVLALNEQNLLDRRLQTFLVKKKIVGTAKQARQLITHKHVLVDGKAVNVPSFIVSTDMENKISLKEGKVKVKKDLNQESTAD